MDHYDWVVVGDHPGALLSASLVARLGLSVLVLPVSSSFGLRVSDSGQVFDPESNFILGLRNLVRSDGLLALCLGKMGLQPSEEQLILKDGSLPQVVTPDSRISFYLNESNLNLEWVREFGETSTKAIGFLDVLKEAEPEYLRYWAELPDRFTWVDEPQKRKSRRVVHPSLSTVVQNLSKKTKLSSAIKHRWLSEGVSLDQMSREVNRRDLRETFLGVLYGLLNVPCGDIGTSKTLHLLSLGRSGASFRGGMSAYREFLVRLARRAGAHVPEKIFCKRLFIESGKLVGVQASTHGNMIGVEGGVIGCSLKEARGLLSESGTRVMKRVKSGPTPIGWKFTLALSVHTEAVPPGMGARVIWQEKDAPALEIEVADPSDYGLRENENKVLFVRSVLPFSEQSLDLSYQRLMATRMLRQLMEIMPFLEFHVIRIFPDFRTAETTRIAGGGADSSAQDPLLSLYGFASLEDIPFRLLCFASGGVGNRSGVDGLFVSNEESYPELGSFGSTIAAVESVAWLAHRSGLRGPLV